jgi:hypothetical protein
MLRPFSTEPVEKLWIALRRPAPSYSPGGGFRVLHSTAAFTEGLLFHGFAAFMVLRHRRLITSRKLA